MSVDLDVLINRMTSQIEKEGFLPYEKIKLGKRTAAGVTLHEAVRNALSMKPDDSFYMYWEWKELKNALDQLWKVFDEVASTKTGRKTSCIAMLGRENATQEEVLSLLESAVQQIEIKFPEPHRRPVSSEAQVRFVGKLMGACLHTLGIFATNSGLEYGTVFARFGGEVVSDEQLLERLDNECAALTTDLFTLAKPKTPVIIRALGFAFERTNKIREDEDMSPFTLSEFLFETNSSDPWTSFSDSGVLNRLLDIQPEKAVSSLAAIKKFLNQ